MKVLFDFDLVGDPQIDAQLMDTMLAIKATVIELVSDFRKRIDKDGGIVVVTIAWEKISLKYHFGSDQETFIAVQNLLLEFNWEEALLKQSHVVLN